MRSQGPESLLHKLSTIGSLPPAGSSRYLLCHIPDLVSGSDSSGYLLWNPQLLKNLTFSESPRRVKPPAMLAGIETRLIEQHSRYAAHNGLTALTIAVIASNVLVRSFQIHPVYKKLKVAHKLSSYFFPISVYIACHMGSN